MKRVLVFFIVGVVFFGAFSAQNANAQNANIGQRIIGTWVEPNGNTWVFNANGNLSMNGVEGKFGVTDTKLAIYANGQVLILNISISSDGRTLILDNSQFVGFWLTKR